MGNLVLTFRRNVPLSSSGFESVNSVITLSMKAVFVFRNIGKKLPNYTAQQPRISGSSLSRGGNLWSLFYFSLFLCSSFIESCWCRIDFLWENVTIKIFVIFGRHSPWIRSITSERRGNWGCCWVQNVGIKNPENMASFTAGSLCCGTRAAGPGRRYGHILSVFICCTETLRRFQVGIWWNGFRHGRIVRY